MDFFSVALAVIKAIPAVKSLVDRFIAFYVDREIASMKKENSEAITIAVLKHDQRPLEEALGSPKAGKPSSINGTQIVDSLPGVDK